MGEINTSGSNLPGENLEGTGQSAGAGQFEVMPEGSTLSPLAIHADRQTMTVAERVLLAPGKVATVIAPKGSDLVPYILKVKDLVAHGETQGTIVINPNSETE